MARFNLSQFKSKMLQLERRIHSTINHKISNYNRDLTKSINAYNQAVRNINTSVGKNRQIIQREVAKLNNYKKTSYVKSVIAMQTYYNKIINSYLERSNISKDENQLLDLIESENANSIITANLLEDNTSPIKTTEEIEIGDKLKMISEDLNNRWKGALFALNINNPDATRHFCTSTREIITNFIELKAPDEDVFSYNPNCQTTEKGNPTRKEKLKYMMRNKINDENIVAFADENINNILHLNYILSGGTHGEAGKYSFEKLEQVKKRVECGINFLCEICV